MNTLRKLAIERVEQIQDLLKAYCDDIILYEKRINGLIEEMEAEKKEADNLVFELNELNRFLGEPND